MYPFYNSFISYLKIFIIGMDLQEKLELTMGFISQFWVTLQKIQFWNHLL